MSGDAARTTLGDFGASSDDGADLDRERPECSAAGCDSTAGWMCRLCPTCEAHKRIGPDNDPVEREDGYDPDDPRCVYCGRVPKPADDPRRCPACATLDADEVIGA